MDTITRKKNTGQPGNGGEFGTQNRSEAEVQLGEDTRRFTPTAADGRTRLEFTRGDVEVISGNPFVTGRGLHGRVRIDGELYDVHGKSCGANCFCDAKLVPVPDEGLHVTNRHLSFKEDGAPGSRTVYSTFSLPSKQCSDESYNILRKRNKIEPYVIYDVTDADGVRTFTVLNKAGELHTYDDYKVALRRHAGGRD